MELSVCTDEVQVCEIKNINKALQKHVLGDFNKLLWVKIMPPSRL